MSSDGAAVPSGERRTELRDLPMSLADVDKLMEFDLVTSDEFAALKRLTAKLGDGRRRP